MLIYIVKTLDDRGYFLYQMLKEEYECYYGIYNGEKNIKVLILPMDGIDEFGYIKYTTIDLETILKNNKIEKIYTGHINKKIMTLSQKYNFIIKSFYNDEKYFKKDLILKDNIIKAFLEEKLNTTFSDIKLLIIGDEVLASYYKEKLQKERLNIFTNVSDYDALLVFNMKESYIPNDKITICMPSIKDLDLSIILNSKNIYFINQLEKQYLTKSGAKIMYDCL